MQRWKRTQSLKSRQFFNIYCVVYSIVLSPAKPIPLCRNKKAEWLCLTTKVQNRLHTFCIFELRKKTHFNELWQLIIFLLKLSQKSTFASINGENWKLWSMSDKMIRLVPFESGTQENSNICHSPDNDTCSLRQKAPLSQSWHETAPMLKTWIHKGLFTLQTNLRIHT